MKNTKEQLQRERIYSRFMEYDQKLMIDLFSLESDADSIFIEFLKKTYRIDRKTAEMFEGDRLASIDETASVYEYLTKSTHLPLITGKWESIESLCTNTTDTSLGRYLDYLKPFNGDLEKMQQSLIKLGGQPQDKGDVSAIIFPFKDVPVWVQYWEADDEFPASIQFLFDAGITEHFRWSLLWNMMTCITDRMKEEAGL